jgi:hypothetical protein
MDSLDNIITWSLRVGFVAWVLVVAILILKTSFKWAWKVVKQIIKNNDDCPGP